MPSSPGIIPCGPSTSISTPAASSSSGLIRLSWQRNSRTAACVQPCSMQKPACSGPRIISAWPPLPVEKVDGLFIAVGERAQDALRVAVQLLGELPDALDRHQR